MFVFTSFFWGGEDVTWGEVTWFWTGGLQLSQYQMTHLVNVLGITFKQYLKNENMQNLFVKSSKCYDTKTSRYV